jgi:hypothetical protein
LAGSVHHIMLALPTRILVGVAVAVQFVVPLQVLGAWVEGPSQDPPPPLASAPAPVPPSALDAAMDRVDRLQSEVQALRQKTDDQEKKIEELKSENGEVWLTAQRAQQIRGIVADALSDSSTRTSLRTEGATAGYDQGFYLQSADGNYRMNIGGQVQTRFAYAYATPSSLTAEERQNGAGNESGFELRRVRINFFGHVFDPSWTYRVQFASDRDSQNLNNPFNPHAAVCRTLAGESVLQHQVDSGHSVGVGGREASHVRLIQRWRC